MMTKTLPRKHIIWKSQIDDAYIEGMQDIFEENNVTDEYEQYLWAVEDNERALEFERENLNIDIDEPILVIASLGLWDGRRDSVGTLTAICRIRSSIFATILKMRSST